MLTQIFDWCSKKASDTKSYFNSKFSAALNGVPKHQKTAPPINHYTLNSNLQFYFSQVILFGWASLCWHSYHSQGQDEDADQSANLTAQSLLLTAAGLMVGANTLYYLFAPEKHPRANAIIPAVYKRIPSYEQVGGVMGKIHQYIANDAVGYYYGLTIPIDGAAWETFWYGQDTRRVFGRAVYTNLKFYLSQALIYGWADLFWQSYISENNNSYLKKPGDWTAYGYMATVYGSMFVANTLFGMLLAHTTSKEHSNREYFPVCKCCKKSLLTIINGQYLRGNVRAIQGDLTAGAYFISNIAQVKATAWMTSWIPVIGEYVEYPGWMLAYGMALIDYNLKGMCTECRTEVLGRNKGYAIGVMTALIGLQKGAEWVLRYTTGVQNTFTNDFIFSVLYLYFVVAVVSVNRPLPGKGKGIDLFYPGRCAMQWALKRAARIVNALLADQQERPEWAENAEYVWNLSTTQTIKKALLRDYNDLDSFAATPAARLFLELRGKDIDETLDWATWIRSLTITKGAAATIPYIKPYIPEDFLSPELIKMIERLLDKKLDPWLKAATNAMLRARNRSQPLDETPTKIYDGREVDLDASQEAYEGTPKIHPVESKPKKELIQRPKTKVTVVRQKEATPVAPALTEQGIFQNYERKPRIIPVKPRPQNYPVRPNGLSTTSNTIVVRKTTGTSLTMR